jgi:hypothetical protein
MDNYELIIKDPALEGYKLVKSTETYGCGDCVFWNIKGCLTISTACMDEFVLMQWEKEKEDDKEKRD